MITVCGEALVDLVSSDGRQFTAHAGGSPANVAVGLASLGIRVSLLARLGGDFFGRLLRDHITSNGVDPRDLVAGTEPTTLAVAIVDECGVADYDFYVEGTADWQWSEAELPARLPEDVTAFHTGSMALEQAPGAARLTELIQREHGRAAVTISYDPNIRLARRGRRDVALARIEELVALSDVVKVSAEDLAWLLPGTPAAEVAAAWCALGPAVVVVTLGAEGALGVGTAVGLVRVDAPRVVVVDTVGAGDAFTAGFLAELSAADLLGGVSRARLSTLGADALSSMLDQAARLAALTCARSGALPPTRTELHSLP